ncbi:tryptophan 7-halogenase [Colwellia sp. 1_MG-2023]|uniref:tryptophan halogenase family protein n=1 Tax=unclassified Colwellia TaxID=196834 RepID=UPI001C08C6C6|nr:MULTISPECIES: tryptophan halogenase family protein [unclassified Colwellia]MBU2924835.1 tryptophan 7-halogenase [Colwellia sp. C2M11]MDO6654069.1 tryptophan 7-halogenase [Colwellia sp. 3_MG-2023]MDO6665487.1 tryptophan 7-halogenase [Colwellia sp. 2_MG-2023]MDO6689754.1 tryptophan 7-halogenase [Colwellia sp. 1_MG-2023]
MEKTKPDPLKSYVIVGGGTAGWISAAVLSRALTNTKSNITIIESPNVPTIGVGEATIPSIIDLLEYLRIPLKEFILATNATFKLGIKFIDWQKKGHHYWNPFGGIGNKIDGKPFYQHFLKHQFEQNKYNFTDFSPAAALAKENKFYLPNPNVKNNLSSSSYALHFDASLVAKYLTKYCKNKGVNLIKGHVESTELNQKGHIDKLIFNDGEKLTGDFFIDCSGQKALLIHKSLRVGYEDWQHFLPVNKAVTAQTNTELSIPPYTQATAHEHGWRWKIPLQNRIGNGYVYCSDYCSNDEALTLLKKNCSSFITEPKFLSFTTGKRDKIWHKNCLAVGLSSGFLEPLESTSIYLIMKTMLNFVQNMPNKSFDQPPIDEFNRLIDNEYHTIRDFIVLHYCTSKRTDSAFWQMWHHIDIPKTLQTKIELFKCQGKLYENHYDLFSADSWYCVLEGMGVRPQSYDPLIDASNFKKIEQAFVSSVTELSKSIGKTLSHDEFISKLRIS